MEKSNTGKHVKQPPADNITEGFMPASEVLAKDNDEKKRSRRIASIIVLIVVGVIAALYIAGVIVFNFMFMPNTHISNVDVSFATPDKVRSEIDDTVDNFTIQVHGNGLDATLSSSDAGLDIDSENLTDTMQAAQNPWAWPVEVFTSRDMTQAFADSLSATTLADVIDEKVAEVNATATPSENAKVQFDEAKGAFVVIPETQGTQLDSEKVLQEVLDQVMSLEDEADITDDMLLEATYKSDDPKVVAACDEANSLTGANIDLTINSQSAGKIDAAKVSQWVSISPEYAVGFDDAAMSEWAQGLANQYDTVGATRTYTRPDGKQVTVSGGDYGWAVDRDKLVASVEEGIRTSMVGAMEIPVLQTGKAFTIDSGKDWGNRYIDVDIAEQHARLYDDNGQVIWESDVVTGSPTAERATPQGVYDINSMGKNVTLVGRDKTTGEITYETPVSFWMPFVGNSVGLHDATWQSAFGGTRYSSGFGSHGCVNLPYDKAQALYGLIQTGDVVVVHG